MDAASYANTLERIEAALARIEQAAARQDSGDAELRTRHEHLKSAVAHSLGELDQLIARQRR